MGIREKISKTLGGDDGPTVTPTTLNITWVEPDTFSTIPHEEIFGELDQSDTEENGDSGSSFTDSLEFGSDEDDKSLSDSEKKDILKESESDEVIVEATLVPATDPVLIQNAIETVAENEGTLQRRAGVDEEAIGELSVDNPVETLRQFDAVLAEYGPEIVEILQSVDEQSSGSILESETQNTGDYFEYLIAEFDGGVIVGGADNIIDNIAAALEFSVDQRELVRQAYIESVRSVEGVGDLRAHSLVSDVLVIFFDESPRPQSQADDERSQTEA